MRAIVFGLLLVCSTVSAKEHWTGFRGDGTNYVKGQELPTEWSSRENVVWRVATPGYGQSTPVIWKERLYVTSVRGTMKELCLVTCYDAVTGKQQWESTFDASQTGLNNPSTSRAAPTPAVDERGLYAFFESGDLVALSHKGQCRWKRSLADEFGEIKNHHGIASSLAQTDDVVVVLLDHDGPSYLMAVDKATGRTRWKVDRPSGLSWTSPAVWEFGGQAYVVVSSNGSLAIYNADSGTEVWRENGMTGNLIPSPAVRGDMVIVGAGESGLTFDRAAAAKSNRCYRMKFHNGRLRGKLLWQVSKTVLHHASPVIHKGHVYLLTKVGVVHCLDLATGEEQFAKRLPEPCWATPIAADGRLYLFGKNGVTAVLQTGPSFVELAVNRLWDESTIAANKKSARELPENQFPSLPEQGREQMEEMLDEVVGHVVYAVATDGEAFFIRTGSEVICIRNEDRNPIDPE